MYCVRRFHRSLKLFQMGREFFKDMKARTCLWNARKIYVDWPHGTPSHRKIPDRLGQHIHKNETNSRGSSKTSIYFENPLSAIGKSYFLMKYAIVPPAQMVIAAYHFQVNKGLHRYKNVVINQHQTGVCGLYRQFLYFNNSSNVRT